MTTKPNNDLRLVFAWSVVVLLMSFTIDIVHQDSWSVTLILRLLIAAPLVFLLTGHTILRAIGFVVPSLLEYVIYATGASIAGCIAGGFLLNLVHALTPVGWGIWFVLLTGIMGLIAGLRKPGPIFALSAILPHLQRWHRVVLGVAALVTLGGYLLAIHDESMERQFRYTEFWMLPKGPGKVLIGVQNADEGPENLMVEVTADDQLVAQFRGIHVVAGEKWTRNIYTPAVAKKIRAKLYLNGTVYRRVSVATGEPGETKQKEDE